MDFSKKPWWQTDAYTDDSPFSKLDDPSLWGPRGQALVPLYKAGSTGKGWGRETFMEAYLKNKFAAPRVMHGYDKDEHAYAWVMRSGQVLCVDIDGKNGGLEHASELGFLPPTLSEVSKSGNGYHLFYRTNEVWDAEFGYEQYRDIIGLVEGVDIRAVGCVYHHKAQRWNDRDLAPLPDHLHERLIERTARRERNAINIQKTLELDKEEILMMQDELVDELNKPIPAGKRNMTLFAIGSKMKLAQVPKWDHLVRQRGYSVGLEDEELHKIVSNIDAYGGVA